MRRLLAIIIFVSCAFTMVAWKADYDSQDPCEAGERQADRNRQANDENIKRTQGDENGRRAIQNQGALLNDDRGTW